MPRMQRKMLPEDKGYEEVHHFVDPDTDLDSVVVIHDTTLGPSLGGIRMKRYPSHAAAAADARQLAEAMTYKAALAGLALGGGKSVINANPADPNRTALLLAHASRIAALDGRYIPAVDMGTTVADLDLVGTVVPMVSSRRRNPSEFTARGVVASIRSAVEATEGRALAGLIVGVQGLGHVGALVATYLLAEGASVVVTDTDRDRAHRFGLQHGVSVIPPLEIVDANLDVLCPCAGGGVITSQLVPSLKSRYVIGAANNVLADTAVAEQLRLAEIVHVPDFVANAGGLIACAAEVQGNDDGLSEAVERIGYTTVTLLRAAEHEQANTVDVAMNLANQRIAAASKAPESTVV